LQSLQEENDRLKSRQNESLSGLQSHIADLESQLDNVYNENGQLLAKLDEIQSQMSILKEEKFGLDHALSKREGECKLLSERLETESQKYKDTVEELERVKIEKESLEGQVCFSCVYEF
jgi:chromosome segregation ATPase